MMKVSMIAQNTTRQDELIRILTSLAESLTEVYWIVLVDQDGLVMACVPPKPEVSPESIAAMTAAMASTVERILGELDGGQLRYSSVVGSQRHHVTILLPEGCLLTIGLPPDVSPQKTFQPIRQWIPELLNVLKMRFTSS
jgi:predicted regulator of Ras-like GTPase activity (Roadblock/LC7/MglB family)